jgi:hypothetical protein
MLATASTEGKPGSDVYVPALIKYLQNEMHISCKFDNSHTIQTVDDALITKKTKEEVESIFIEAKKLGLKDPQVIADCTGGPRSMTLGIFLACLDGKRDIQFMGTHYDDKNRPGGPTIPMITKFSVKTIDKEE